MSIRHAFVIVAVALLSLSGNAFSASKAAAPAQAEWIKDAAELADTAKAVYAAAQAKDRDKVVELTDRLNDACASCHNAYRRGADAARCTPRP